MNLNATLFAQFVVFFVLVGFIVRFIWPPLMSVLDERARKIAEGLSLAERCKADLIAVENKVQRKLAHAHDISQQHVNDAKKYSELIIAEAKKTANEQALSIILNAKLNAKKEVLKAREVLRHELGALVLKGVEQLLKREVNAAMHSDFLNELKSEL